MIRAGPHSLFPVNAHTVLWLPSNIFWAVAGLLPNKQFFMDGAHLWVVVVLRIPVTSVCNLPRHVVVTTTKVKSDSESSVLLHLVNVVFVWPRSHGPCILESSCLVGCGRARMLCILRRCDAQALACTDPS